VKKLFDRNKYKKFGGPKEIDNRFFVDIENKFIFAEVPKVGISTTKKTLVEAITNSTVDYNVHDREKFILKSPDFYQLTEEEFDRYFKFSFVRDPYTRILSGYIDKVLNNPGIELKQILRFANLPLNHELTFLEFLKILEVMDYRQIDSHFRPQHIILCISVVKYDFIGRFEYFEDDLNYVIKKLFNDNINIKTVNHHKTGASNKEQFNKYYNNETIALVQKIYAQDFLYFNYRLQV
jgi:hypothetical protein